jgi:DNA-binding response OmpR family regulator
MLPGMNGLEICRILRNESSVPIVLLTAKTAEQDRIAGLDLGADDYVTKPFSPKELAARIRALFRRSPDQVLQLGPQEFRFGNLTINFPKHVAFLDKKDLDLTEVEFKLLGQLVREPNRVFSRSQLIEKVLGYDFQGFDRTIDVHILNLRRKLEPDPDRPKFIKTIYGSGYKFTSGAE